MLLAHQTYLLMCHKQSLSFPLRECQLLSLPVGISLRNPWAQPFQKRGALWMRAFIPKAFHLQKAISW